MKFSRIIVLFLLLLPLSLVEGGWQQDFKQGFSSKNSWEKHKAVLSLDPDDPAQLKMLFQVLKMNNWYLRSSAWKKLSQYSSEKTKTALEKELKGTSSSKYRIREGIIVALAIKKETSFIPQIILKLKDPAWPVRRSATMALADMPDKRSVGPLVDCWKKNKKNLRIWVRVRESLEKITNRFMGNEVRNWENWWYVNKNSFEVGSKDEEASKKAEESGDKTKRVQTVLRGVNLDYATRGKGSPLFVLPDFGFNENYILPYFTPLEDVCKIFYIKLPPITSFKNVQRQAGRIVYPVDQLVDAFDELRKKYNQKKVAILGHGVSAWVAMRYASKYPRNVSSLIVVSGYSGQDAYRKGVELLERTGKQSGDIEMEHFAQSLMIMQTGKAKFEPQSRDEAIALMRKEWTLRFADQGDAILGDLQKKSWKPDAQAIVPAFELRKEPKYEVPALIIFGKYSLFTSAGDGQNMAKHYGRKARFYLFPRSRRMPFIEENLNFVRLVKGFFRKY